MGRTFDADTDTIMAEIREQPVKIDVHNDTLIQFHLFLQTYEQQYRIRHGWHETFDNPQGRPWFGIFSYAYHLLGEGKQWGDVRLVFNPYTLDPFIYAGMTGEWIELWAVKNLGKLQAQIPPDMEDSEPDGTKH